MTLVDHWNIYYIFLGSHIPNEQQGCLVFCLGGAKSIVDNDDIGILKCLHVL